MQIKAEGKYIRMSPRKVRLVVASIRSLPLAKAMLALKFINKQAAKPILVTLKSAVTNAVNNFKLKEEDLKIASIEVNEGPSLKRWRAGARGVAQGYKRRTSHIKVVLEEIKK